MKVSYGWLKNYTSVRWDPNELADRLTMAGLEVEGIYDLAPALSGVYVGKITKVESHPHADLKVCQISIGEKVLQIVCGAPNVRENMKVPVAVEGSCLADGRRIEAVNLHGVMSYGMACSEAELGIGEDDSGLMELPEEAEEGQDLVSELGLDDKILDVSIYANRPDCMGIIGIAREVAALSGTKLKFPEINFSESTADIHSLTSVKVEDPEKCPRYSARIIRNINIKQSPLWMQQRLRASGMRPINNVVDITNFVMLEMGQPLHAFDYDKLAENRIVVRTPATREKVFTTLDGVKRELTEEMLLICDAESPVCIGGVMGGENSQVTGETNTILLEAANFAPISIRRTAHKLGISSEAVARFEKGIDPNLTVTALNRAAQLLQEYAGAEIVGGTIDINNVHEKKRVIDFRPETANRILGTEIPQNEMISILNSLELSVDDSVSPLQVTIPSFRQDLELECDLIEEVARFWGYDKIPITLPQGADRGGESDALSTIDSLKASLIGAGLNEVITYSFVNPLSVQKSGLSGVNPESEMIRLLNPLTEDYAVMRTSLMPSLLACAAYNVNRQQERLCLFEFGSVYLAKELPLEERPCEGRRLGLLLYGSRQEEHWSIKPENFDFYDLKGLVQLVLENFTGDFRLKKSELAVFHPGRQAQIQISGETAVQFGEVHPNVQNNYGIPNRIYLAEINLDRLFKYKKSEPQFHTLPRFPAVHRDMALLVPEDVQVADIVAVLKQAGGDLLKSISIFDVYQGKQVETGKKSVAFAFVFQADRTLTDNEVNDQLDLMYQQAVKECQAVIR